MSVCDPKMPKYHRLSHIWHVRCKQVEWRNSKFMPVICFTYNFVRQTRYFQGQNLHRGSCNYICDHALLNLSKELTKSNKIQGLLSILSLFRNKLKNSVMQGHKRSIFYLSYDVNFFYFVSYFWCEKAKMWCLLDIFDKVTKICNLPQVVNWF